MQQTINIPEGFELVQTSDTAYEIKKKESQLPKTWEEFCKMHYIKRDEVYIDTTSEIIVYWGAQQRVSTLDKNLLPTRKDAEGILALMQLIQLRDYYNNGWKPDWTDDSIKFIIECLFNQIHKDCYCNFSKVLSFKTLELRDEFLENFKDLIEQAKDFI